MLTTAHKSHDDDDDEAMKKFREAYSIPGESEITARESHRPAGGRYKDPDEQSSNKSKLIYGRLLYD
jgi:hypothetical protein